MYAPRPCLMLSQANNRPNKNRDYSSGKPSTSEASKPRTEINGQVDDVAMVISLCLCDTPAPGLTLGDIITRDFTNSDLCDCQVMIGTTTAGRAGIFIAGIIIISESHYTHLDIHVCLRYYRYRLISTSMYLFVP